MGTELDKAPNKPSDLLQFFSVQKNKLSSCKLSLQKKSRMNIRIPEGKSDLNEIMKMSEPAFSEWDNEEDEIYNDL